MRGVSQKSFSFVEWLIAWRYLRSRKSEGGVSAISWIALIGVALGVFAMIATFSVREGFRGEYIRTVLGNEGHATIYPIAPVEVYNVPIMAIADFEAMDAKLEAVEGVISSIPLVIGQVIASPDGQSMEAAQVLGIHPDDFRAMKTITENEESFGNLEAFDGDGVALGNGLAYKLGLTIGSKVEFTTLGKLQTVIGLAPRTYVYDVAYIYSSGNDYLDSARAYVPIEAAQSYFDMEGVVSQIDFTVEAPESIESYLPAVQEAIGEDYYIRTWKEKNARILSGLKTEDNLMFILTSILVLVATFTIVAGQIMLVKNKTSDIAILRTMGYSRGAITRIFFLTGVILGVVGTIFGVILGVLFSLYFTPIFYFVNFLIGGGAENTWALQNIPALEAKLTWPIIFRSVAMALLLSFIITFIPARSAAKLDPAEALRHG